MISRFLLASVLFGTAGWMTAFAQAPTGLRVSVASGSSTVALTEGATVPVVSDGRDVTLQVRLTNGGTSTITVNQISLSGSDFVLLPPTLPLVLATGTTATFGVRYTPASGRSSNATIGINYTEGAQRTFSFGVTGGAPDFSYILTTATGEAGSISPNGRVTFPATRLRSTQTQTLVVRNTGTAPGTLRSVVLTGTDFSTSVATPTLINAGEEIAIPIAFTPQTNGAATGSILLTFDGRTAAFGLAGTGAAPEYVLAYALRINGNTFPLANDSRLVFPPTAATSTSLADVVIANEGNAPGSVRSVSISGNAFQLTGVPLLPATIAPGSAARFSVQYSPTQIGNSTGTLRIVLDDRTIVAALEGSTSSPDFSLAYVDPASNNILAVPAGGTLAFPGTNTGSVSSFVVVLRNQGPGTGFVNAISLTGTGFQLTDVPALPATVEAARDLRFGVRFAPQDRQRQTGTLRVDFSGGSIQVNLEGSGLGSDLSYELISPSGDSSQIRPGSEFSISSNVGATATNTFRLVNRGNADAQIASITISGQGFQLANVFTPLTLKPGDGQNFDVVFAPTQPGASRGRLRIGNDNFDIAGNGLGPRLVFSSINNAGTTPVAENGTVVFTNTRVGEVSRSGISVENTGTTPATISAIDVTPPDSVFALEGLPALPLTLNPGATLGFTVAFSPNNVGNAAANLRINNSVLALSGAGQQPVPLPEYQIEGPSGTQQPLQQLAYGLRLSSRYPLPVRGTLNLGFVSDVFASNPAVQFATGGRTVNFVIPANTDRAVFENGLTEIRVQTGTVAGTINLVPSFTTLAGLDLTPATRTSATLTLNRAAPRLLSLEVASRAGNSLQLVLSGYSTTRTLRQLDLRITPRDEEEFANTNLVLNVESSSLVWFQSELSQGFGGVFTITIPLNLQRGSSTEDLVRYIQTIAITATNEVGPSNSISVAF